MERPRSIGMAWYRAEDYDRLRTMMADGDKLPDSHAAWLMSAEQVEGEVARSGVAVVRTTLDPDAFAAWCDGQGLPRNARARSSYAAEMASLIQAPD